MEHHGNLQFHLFCYHHQDNRPGSDRKEATSWLMLFGRTILDQSVCLHIPLWTCTVLQIPPETTTTDVIAYLNTRIEKPKKELRFRVKNSFALFHGKRDEEGKLL